LSLSNPSRVRDLLPAIRATFEDICPMCCDCVEALPNVLAEGELDVGAVVLGIGITQEVQEPWIVLEDKTCDALRFPLGANRFPRAAILWKVGAHPPFALAVGGREGERVGVFVRDDETTARESLERPQRNVLRRGADQMHPP